MTQLVQISNCLMARSKDPTNHQSANKIYHIYITYYFLQAHDFMNHVYNYQ